MRTYTIQPGDDMIRLAALFGFSIQAILGVNPQIPIGEDGLPRLSLFPGQVVNIPDATNFDAANPSGNAAGGPAVPQIGDNFSQTTTTPTGGSGGGGTAATSTLRPLPGETLRQLSIRTGIPIETLMGLNPNITHPDVPLPDVAITVPTGTPSATVSQPGQPNTNVTGIEDINGDGLITAADVPEVFGPFGSIGAPPGYVWAFDPTAVNTDGVPQPDYVLRKLDPIGDRSRIDEWVWIPDENFDPNNPHANGTWTRIANPEAPDDPWKGLPAGVRPWFVEVMNGTITVDQVPNELARNWIRFFGRGIIEQFTDMGRQPESVPFGLGLPSPGNRPPVDGIVPPGGIDNFPTGPGTSTGGDPGPQGATPNEGAPSATPPSTTSPFTTVGDGFPGDGAKFGQEMIDNLLNFQAGNGTIGGGVSLTTMPGLNVGGREVFWSPQGGFFVPTDGDLTNVPFKDFLLKATLQPDGSYAVTLQEATEIARLMGEALQAHNNAVNLTSFETGGNFSSAGTGANLGNLFRIINENNQGITVANMSPEVQALFNALVSAGLMVIDPITGNATRTGDAVTLEQYQAALVVAGDIQGADQIGALITPPGTLPTEPTILTAPTTPTAPALPPPPGSTTPLAPLADPSIGLSAEAAAQQAIIAERQRAESLAALEAVTPTTAPAPAPVTAPTAPAPQPTTVVTDAAGSTTTATTSTDAFARIQAAAGATVNPFPPGTVEHNFWQATH